MLKKLTILRDRVENWDDYPFSIPAIRCFKELAFRSRICFFAGENGTSPVLLGYPNAQIISFDEGRIHEVEYTQTASMQIVKRFVNDRENFLQELLQETPNLFDQEKSRKER